MCCVCRCRLRGLCLREWGVGAGAVRGVGLGVGVLVGPRVLAGAQVLMVPRMLDRRALKKALAEIARTLGKLAGVVA